MAKEVNSIYKDHQCVKFLLGKQDALLLVYKNYLYKRINGCFPKTTWKCTKGCSATVHTNNGIFQKAKDVSFHNHPPLIDEISVIETNMKIKQRAKTELNLSLREIHKEERTSLLLREDNDIHLRIDSYAKSRSRLYKYRQSVFPKNPETRNEIKLTNDWKLTLDKSENFLLVDDGFDDKILIFGTKGNLRNLCRTEYVVSDGTFSVHPGIFSQFYVFHAPYLNKVLPLLFCLLLDKTYNTYCRLLRLIQNAAKEIGETFCPRKFHIDYESVMIKAITDVFSEGHVQGCLFHYAQCIWRKVQEIGISNAYKTHSHIRKWIRRFSALPFLPLHDVDDGFIAIHESSPDPIDGTISADQINKINDYMLMTWVHDSDSIFKPSIWNQFNNDDPRTTNNAEGWHNKLNRDAKSRLSFYQFVHFLQRMQVDLDAMKFELISESPSTNIKYKNVNVIIGVAKENYRNGNVSILKYLDSVSIALKLD